MERQERKVCGKATEKGRWKGKIGMEVERQERKVCGYAREKGRWKG